MNSISGDSPIPPGNGSSGPDPVEKVLQAFVYAPIGLAVMAWQAVPQVMGAVVSRVTNLGEAEACVAAQLRQAKMIGQFAVAYGSHHVRREVDGRLADARRRAEDLTGRLAGIGADDEEDLLAGPSTPPAQATTPAQAPPPAPARAAAASGTAASGTATARASRSTVQRPPVKSPTGKGRAAKKAVRLPRAGDLPIPDYDELSASQVVQRLNGLTPAELAAVRAYEAGGRGRKTVLGAVDRLRH